MSPRHWQLGVIMWLLLSQDLSIVIEIEGSSQW